MVVHCRLPFEQVYGMRQHAARAGQQLRVLLDGVRDELLAYESTPVMVGGGTVSVTFKAGLEPVAFEELGEGRRMDIADVPVTDETGLRAWAAEVLGVCAADARWMALRAREGGAPSATIVFASDRARDRAAARMAEIAGKVRNVGRYGLMASRVDLQTPESGKASRSSWVIHVSPSLPGPRSSPFDVCGQAEATGGVVGGPSVRLSEREAFSRSFRLTTPAGTSPSDVRRVLGRSLASVTKIKEVAPLFQVPATAPLCTGLDA